jgi:hypothetical protein
VKGSKKQAIFEPGMPLNDRLSGLFVNYYDFISVNALITGQSLND